MTPPRPTPEGARHEHEIDNLLAAAENERDDTQNELDSIGAWPEGEQDRLELAGRLALWDGIITVLRSRGAPAGGAPPSGPWFIETTANWFRVQSPKEQHHERPGLFCTKIEAEALAVCDALNRLAARARADKAEAERDALWAALGWALDYISDGVDETETPEHACEFTSNPEKGACDFHEAYWEARAALSGAAPEPMDV